MFYTVSSVTLYKTHAHTHTHGASFLHKYVVSHLLLDWTAGKSLLLKNAKTSDFERLNSKQMRMEGDIYLLVVAKAKP